MERLRGSPLVWIVSPDAPNVEPLRPRRLWDHLGVCRGGLYQHNTISILEWRREFANLGLGLGIRIRDLGASRLATATLFLLYLFHLLFRGCLRVHMAAKELALRISVYRNRPW